MAFTDVSLGFNQFREKCRQLFNYNFSRNRKKTQGGSLTVMIVLKIKWFSVGGGGGDN